MKSIRSVGNSKKDLNSIISRANILGIAVPAFNVPYLPMIEPIIRAVADQNSFALIEVARLEWLKFESKSMGAVMAEFLKWYQPKNIRIHLDHIPVIDEDNNEVDYLTIIKEAIDLGYQSVMVDGTRVSLEENIEATKKVVDLAHEAGVACEAELGAVIGHETGPFPPYEELFASGYGFTDENDAAQFVRTTQCDWLSIAIGNIHGRISSKFKNKKKIQAKLNFTHLEKLHQVTKIPLVLHGGSGISQADMRTAIKKGITKVNIGTEIRQAYESKLGNSSSVSVAQESVYERVSWLIKDYFCIAGSRHLLMEDTK